MVVVESVVVETVTVESGTMARECTADQDACSSATSSISLVDRPPSTPTAPPVRRRQAGGVAVEWKDRRIHALEKIDGASMVLYHPLEHVVLGGWVMGDAYPGVVDGDRWSAWSCRAWLVFIIAEWEGAACWN